MRNSHRTSLQGIVQLDHCHSAFCHQTQGLVEYQTESLCECGGGRGLVTGPEHYRGIVTHQRKYIRQRVQ